MSKQNKQRMEVLSKTARIGQGLGLCLLALALSAGCGPSRPETAEVSGRVTFQGKPVPEGRVLFWPPSGRPAMAEIKSDGSYELRTFDAKDGAVIGTHRVTIKATRTHFQNNDPSKAVVEWLVPQRYENVDKSPLKAEVAAGKNTIDFELTN